MFPLTHNGTAIGSLIQSLVSGWKFYYFQLKNENEMWSRKIILKLLQAQETHFYAKIRKCSNVHGGISKHIFLDHFLSGFF